MSIYYLACFFVSPRIYSILKSMYN